MTVSITLGVAIIFAAIIIASAIESGLKVIALSLAEKAKREKQ